MKRAVGVPVHGTMTLTAAQRAWAGPPLAR